MELNRLSDWYIGRHSRIECREDTVQLFDFHRSLFMKKGKMNSTFSLSQY